MGSTTNNTQPLSLWWKTVLFSLDLCSLLAPQSDLLHLFFYLCFAPVPKIGPNFTHWDWLHPNHQHGIQHHFTLLDGLSVSPYNEKFLVPEPQCPPCALGLTVRVLYYFWMWQRPYLGDPPPMLSSLGPSFPWNSPWWLKLCFMFTNFPKANCLPLRIS